ncbi:MAG: hypothetical protein U0821_23645 [Chloroflexota bacterium]
MGSVVVGIDSSWVSPTYLGPPGRFGGSGERYLAARPGSLSGSPAGRLYVQTMNESSTGYSFEGFGHSDDNGLTWTVRRREIPRMTTVVADPRARNGVFTTPASRTSRGSFNTSLYPILHSDDGGLTWREWSRTARLVTAMAVDATVSRMIVAIESGALLETTDHGETWRELNGPPGVSEYRDLSISPFDPNVLFAVTATTPGRTEAWVFRGPGEIRPGPAPAQVPGITP